MISHHLIEWQSRQEGLNGQLLHLFLCTYVKTADQMDSFRQQEQSLRPRRDMTEILEIGARFRRDKLGGIILYQSIIKEQKVLNHQQNIGGVEWFATSSGGGCTN